MNATRLSSILFSAIALAACAASPDGAADHDPTAAGSEALSTCGPRPPSTVCGGWVCSGGMWRSAPAPNGTACTSNLQPGTCQGGTCQVTQLTGALFPSYYILNVMYAPPGTASTVDYGTGTTLGTTTTTTSSWKNASSVTISNRESFLGFGASNLSLTAGNETSSTSTSTTDVKETMQTDFIISGFQDQIDHDADRIYLWLNPEIDVSTYGREITQSLAVAGGGDPEIVYVNVAWLRNPALMPADVATVLQSANITPADYPQILSVDPFALGPNGIDYGRFALQGEYPYEPVAIKGQNPQPTKLTLNKVTTLTGITTSSTQYSVGLSMSGSLGFMDLAKVSLKATDTFTWTDTTTFGNTTASTLSASASIMQPAFGYTGQVLLDVYVDTIYNTFMFTLNGPPTGLSH